MTVFRWRRSRLRGGPTFRGPAPSAPNVWTIGPLASRWTIGPLEPITYSFGPLAVRWTFGPLGQTVGQLPPSR